MQKPTNFVKTTTRASAACFDWPTFFFHAEIPSEFLKLYMATMIENVKVELLIQHVKLYRLRHIDSIIVCDIINQSGIIQNIEALFNCCCVSSI